MAGKIKFMIDEIVRQRAKGSVVVANTTMTKLILKGISPERYHASSPDDPEIIAKMKTIAREMNVSL